MTQAEAFYNQSELIYDSGDVGIKPLFSICLSSYNFANSIELALKTILSQSFKDYEIIMHDDCSTDATCAVAKKYIQSFGRTDAQRVRIYRADKNGGILANRLRAFSHCDGKWLIQTDGDDFSPYNRLELTKKIIDGLDHEPMLISSNCYNWKDGLSYEDAINQNVIGGGIEIDGCLKTTWFGKSTAQMAQVALS